MEMDFANIAPQCSRRWVVFSLLFLSGSVTYSIFLTQNIQSVTKTKEMCQMPKQYNQAKNIDVESCDFR